MRAICSDGRPRCDLYDCATCAMMVRCSMRDGLSRDVSNLQTSKLKPAVQQNRTPALSADSLLLTVPGGIPPPSLRAAHVTDPRAMQPLQVEVSTDVLAPPTSRLTIKVTLKITLGTLLLIVRLCELSPASLTVINRKSLDNHSPATRKVPAASISRVAIVRTPHKATSSPQVLRTAPFGMPSAPPLSLLDIGR